MGKGKVSPGGKGVGPVPPPGGKGVGPMLPPGGKGGGPVPPPGGKGMGPVPPPGGKGMGPVPPPGGKGMGPVPPPCGKGMGPVPPPGGKGMESMPPLAPGGKGTAPMPPPGKGAPGPMPPGPGGKGMGPMPSNQGAIAPPKGAGLMPPGTGGKGTLPMPSCNNGGSMAPSAGGTGMESMPPLAPGGKGTAPMPPPGKGAPGPMPPGPGDKGMGPMPSNQGAIAPPKGAGPMPPGTGGKGTLPMPSCNNGGSMAPSAGGTGMESMPPLAPGGKGTAPMPLPGKGAPGPMPPGPGGKGMGPMPSSQGISAPSLVVPPAKEGGIPSKGGWINSRAGGNVGKSSKAGESHNWPAWTAPGEMNSHASSANVGSSSPSSTVGVGMQMQGGTVQRREDELHDRLLSEVNFFASDAPSGMWDSTGSSPFKATSKSGAASKPPGPKGPGNTGPPPGISSEGSTKKGSGETKSAGPPGMAPIGSNWSSGISSSPILMQPVPPGVWSPVISVPYPKSPGYPAAKIPVSPPKVPGSKGPGVLPKGSPSKGGGPPSKIANSKGQKIIKKSAPPKGKGKGPPTWPIMAPAQNPNSHMFVCPEGEIPLPPTPKKKTAAPSYLSKEKSKLTEAPVYKKKLPPKYAKKGNKAKLTLPPVWMPLPPSQNSSKIPPPGKGGLPSFKVGSKSASLPKGVPPKSKVAGPNPLPLPKAGQSLNSGAKGQPSVPGGLKKSSPSSKFQYPWTQSSFGPTSSLEPTSNCPPSYMTNQGVTKVAMPPKKGSSPFPKLSPKSIIPTYSQFPTLSYVPVQKVSVPSKVATIKAPPNPKGPPKGGLKVVGKIKNSLEPHSRSSVPSYAESIYPTYTSSHSALRTGAKGRFYPPSSTMLPKKSKGMSSFHGQLSSSPHYVTYSPAPTGAAMNDFPPTRSVPLLTVPPTSPTAPTVSVNVQDGQQQLDTKYPTVSQQAQGSVNGRQVGTSGPTRM